MVNQILSKGLHTANEEATTFTTNLMDQLEQVSMLWNTAIILLSHVSTG